MVIGFVVLLLPTSASGAGCGSALQPDSLGAIEADFADALQGSSAVDHQAECESRLSTQRVMGLVVGGVGGLALLFLVLTANATAREDRQSERSSETGSEVA